MPKFNLHWPSGSQSCAGSVGRALVPTPAKGQQDSHTRGWERRGRRERTWGRWRSVVVIEVKGKRNHGHIFGSFLDSECHKAETKLFHIKFSDGRVGSGLESPGLGRVLAGLGFEKS
ncbi:hypothetical protein DFH09DRAFT_1086649 [Mycena vulgaris]|nr:hypothetical protein DFH09DRAFT_1086649 [Mycena vulgaris]